MKNLIETVIKQAYNFGRDNGSGRSEKNLNDFLQTKTAKKALALCEVSISLPSDTELLDWLQKMMTNDDDYCEIFFAGLRDFQSGKATSFQIESNPEKFPTLNAKDIRAVIKEAMTFIGN